MMNAMPMMDQNADADDEPDDGHDDPMMMGGMNPDDGRHDEPDDGRHDGHEPMMMGMGMPMMMPMMMSGMGMPMMCKMTCEMTKDGMMCQMMPMDPSQMDMMKDRMDMMMSMMSNGHAVHDDVRRHADDDVLDVISDGGGETVPLPPIVAA